MDEYDFSTLRTLLDQGSVDESSEYLSDSAEIPNEILEAIRAAPNRGIFNVSSNERYGENVLKCTELVFHGAGTLTLEAWDSRRAPFVAVVARRWKLLAPQLRSLLPRPPELVGADGDEGHPGDQGSPGSGHGSPGGPGAPGGPGQSGQTIQLPPLYLFGERVIDQPGNPLPYMYFLIDASGISGGNGGRGGRGGRGGKGADGHPSSSVIRWGVPHCKRGPGNGGNGGAGGQGGPGGATGAGGNGADVLYVGPPSFIRPITFANLHNGGGEPGSPGSGGRGGDGGEPGVRGSRGQACTWGGHSGSAGPEGPRGVDAADSSKGSKGFADAAIRPDLNDLF
jgi:hypothetical protein